MARKANKAIAQRNAEVISYFRENQHPRPLTNAELGAKFGISPQVVHRLLSEARLISSEAPRARTPQDELQPISDFHLILGAHLSMLTHKLILGGLAPRGTATELGQVLLIPSRRLQLIFNGIVDPTLGELMRIVDKTGNDIVEIITKCQEKLNLKNKSNNTGS